MIEIPEMLNLIEIAVSERGENFRYEDYFATDTHGAIDPYDCQYRHPVTGQPLCIAGCALNEAGLLGSLVEGNIVTSQPRLVDKVSSKALDVLWAAQTAQDDGRAWGEALDNARARAKEWADS